MIVKISAMTLVTVVVLMSSACAFAGPLDPDCTAEKAAKSATVKATVGIGGRCSPGEAVKDSAKNAVGIDDKGPIEKGRHDDKEAVGATKSAIKNVTQ